MKNSRQQRAKTFSLHGLGSGERKRAESAAMEASIERNDFVATCVITSQFDGCLNRFGAGIAEEYFFGLFPGGHGREALGQVNHVRRIKIGTGNVEQFGGLLLNRFDHARMAMSRGNHRDARRKVQKGIAVNVLHDRTTPGFCDQWITARVGRRDNRRVPSDSFFRIRTGKWCDEIGEFHFISESNQWLLHGVLHYSGFVPGPGQCRAYRAHYPA